MEDQTKLTTEPTTTQPATDSTIVAPDTAKSVETSVTPPGTTSVPAEKAPEDEKIPEGVQKRINRVVAQKMVAIEQNQKLRERNQQLEALLAAAHTAEPKAEEPVPDNEQETQEEPDLMMELDKIDELPDEKVPVAVPEMPKAPPTDQQAFIEELQTERRNEAYATMLGNIAKEFPGVDPNKVTGAMLRDGAGWSDAGGTARVRSYFKAAQADQLAAENAELKAKVAEVAGDIGHGPSGIPPANTGNPLDPLAFLAEYRSKKKTTR